MEHHPLVALLEAPRWPREVIRPRARAFHDPIYRATYFVVCCRPEAFLATLRTLTRTFYASHRVANEIVAQCEAHSVEGCNGRCWCLPGRRATTSHAVVIFLRAGSDVSVATHEAWHAARWIFDYRGADLNAAGGEESVAYYLQWLVRQSLGLTT